MISSSPSRNSGSTSPGPSSPTRSSMTRIFALLDAFGPEHREMSLGELARRVNLPKSTTHRLAGSLIQVGGLTRTNNGYRLGTTMYAIGARSWESSLRQAARHPMEQLHRSVRQTLHLAVLTGSDVLYVEKIAARECVPTPAVVSSKLPAHLTGVGKALLAFSDAKALDLVLSSPLQRRTPFSVTEPAILRRDLDNVRRTGIATDNAGTAEHLRCLAVPIWSQGGVSAALSLSFASSIESSGALENALRTTAKAISRAVGESVGQRQTV